MHTRHLKELDGQVEPGSGLLVRAYKRDFDFEYQVARHLDMSRSQWPHLDATEQETGIRLSLAIGSAWLWPEPAKTAEAIQLELFA